MLSLLVSQEPDIAHAWCLFAQVQLALGSPKGGLDLAERAAALEPDNEWAHRLRSVAFQELGDKDHAFVAARDAIAAAPHSWLGPCRLAQVTIAANWNTGVGLSEAQRAVELAPTEPEAVWTMGRVHEVRGEAAEAEQCFKRTLELDPQSVLAHDGLARLRYEGTRGRLSRFNPGRLSAAASGYRDAVVADPRSGIGGANLDVVISTFITRLSYLVFVSAWVSAIVANHSNPSTVARALTFGFVAVPLVFALWFLVRLTPDLRRRVGEIAFNGTFAGPSVIQIVALGLLVASAVAPAGNRKGLAALALLAVVIARVFLIVQAREAARSRSR